MNKHQSTNFKNASALFLIIISLLASSAFATEPVNAVFSGAESVIPSISINFNSTDSPSTASITLCDETTIASAFMWYTIPAVSYVRTISVDTCNTSFDTVLGVFSGSSYASLSVIACNDDRVSVYGDSCYPTSSFIDNINIASGEVIYVVMGGYKNTTSGIADSGVGQITFSLISGDDVPCSSALLNETQTAVINQLSSTDSSLQSDISTSQSHVDSSISSFESSIQTQFDSSSSSLETAIAGVQSTADTIQTDITTANTNLGTLQTTVDSVDSKVNTAQSTLDGDATDVSNIETQLTNLNSSMNANFTSMDNLLDTLQTSATGINSSVASAQSSVDGVQTSLNSLSTQIGTFSSDVQSSFQTTNTDISNVDSSVSSLATQLTDSSNTLNTNITNTDSQITTLHSGISNMLNTLSSLENGIQSDTSALLFYNQVDRFLSDVNAIAPDTFRIPNLYGGQMNDVANYIADTYNNLKTSALSVGTASSTACTSDAFCNYFLNTASGAYADSMAKYTTYVNALKFKTAYYYLQRAYTVLYPITW